MLNMKYLAQTAQTERIKNESRSVGGFIGRKDRIGRFWLVIGHKWS